ncbi:hypothetical protein KKB44_01885 [Candidatus Micrarchaeota archaeon]|nr:hypothetical protein [Candidatus Micrarchaeota archaeon]
MGKIQDILKRQQTGLPKPKVTGPPPLPKPVEEPPTVNIQSKITAIPPSNNLLTFVEKIRSSDKPTKEKLAEVSIRLKQLHRELRGEFGEDEILRLIKAASQKPKEQRTEQDIRILELVQLAQLQKELNVSRLKSQLRERQNGEEPEPTVNCRPEALEFSDERSAPLMVSSPKTSSKVNRFFANPFTWAVGGIGAFTTAMFYTHSFQQLSQAIERIWNAVPNAPPLQLSANAVAIGYGILVGGVLAITEIFRSLKSKKQARAVEAYLETDPKYAEQKSYVIEKLTEILRQSPDTETQATMIVDEMSKNERLFTYIDFFSSDSYKMKRLFDALRLHPDIVKNFDQMCKIAETRLLMRKFFTQLAPHLNNSDVRLEVVRGICKQHPIFKKKLTELFERSAAGSLVNSEMYTRFQNCKFDHETEPRLMSNLLPELERDFQIMINE